jgi:hypothetical protein
MEQFASLFSVRLYIFTYTFIVLPNYSHIYPITISTIGILNKQGREDVNWVQPAQ